MSITPERQLELLQLFAPRLHFDALERWRPSVADSYLLRSTFLDGENLALSGTPPAPPAMAAHHEELESRLNPLADGPDTDTQKRSNVLLGEFGPEQNLADAGIAYGRVAPGKRGTLYLQYWLFYVDNPCVLPPGRHDGDWELVQLRLRESSEGLEPTHVTVAGHGKPVTRKIRSPKRGVDVFVAVDSHASYLDPGAHPMLPLSDVCDPETGAVPQIVLLPVDEAAPDWTFWHGRWGMNRGFGTWLALWLRMRRTPAYLKRLKIGAGESPPSPGRQGDSWDHPARFELRGNGRQKSNLQLQRLAHFIGRLTWPRMLPKVKVQRVAPGSFTIDAKPAGSLARRVSMVSVAFEEEREDGARRGLAMHSVRAGHPAGPFEIPDKGELRWRAAGYNFLRQRGEPMPAKKPTNPPWPLRVSGPSTDQQGARRVFEGALTGHLRRRGATTAPELVSKAGWFWLRLNRTEVDRVIDAARRDGLIAPLDQAKNAAGAPIAEDEWALTDRGRELERTRALSLRDSIVAIRGIGAPVVSVAEKWGKRAVATLAPLLPFLALGAGLNVSIAIAIVAAGAILALTLGTGLRGEAELRRAAEHWPRLHTCRPRIHAWQTTAWRPWERVPIAAAAAAYLIVSAAILRSTGTWKFDVWIAIAIGAGVAAIAWWRVGDVWRYWWRLNRAFRRERDRVRNLRRLTPDDPCVWGHTCQAAQAGGETVTCPRFTLDAVDEPERVPPGP